LARLLAYDGNLRNGQYNRNCGNAGNLYFGAIAGWRQAVVTNVPVGHTKAVIAYERYRGAQ